ncbi:hypothetical protein D3C86_2005330 [compost metagenome]
MPKLEFGHRAFVLFGFKLLGALNDAILEQVVPVTQCALQLNAIVDVVNGAVPLFAASVDAETAQRADSEPSVICRVFAQSNLRVERLQGGQ